MMQTSLLKEKKTFPLMWCWWCCHPFEGEPLHLPHKYDDMRKKFETMGNFCSWECMKTFNLDHNKNRCGIIACNIVMLTKAMYGNVRSIKCAPSRYSLKEFGGTLTIEEFRSYSNTSTRVIVSMPDQMFKVQDVNVKPEIKRYLQASSNEDQKFSEISYATSVGDTLKLKRTKPLKRDENNLEKTLGITRKK